MKCSMPKLFGLTYKLLLQTFIFILFTNSNGLFSVYYCFKGHRFIYIRGLKWYAFGHNVVMLIWLPIMMTIGSSALRQMSPVFTLIYYIGVANIGVSAVLVFVCIVTRFHREKSTIEVFRQMGEVESALQSQAYDHKSQVSRKELEYLDRLMFLRVTLSIIYIIAMTAAFIPELKENPALQYTVVVFSINVHTITHGFVFHFYLGLWVISKCFVLLNQRIKELLHSKGNGNECQVSTWCFIISNYNILSKLLCDLSHIYRFALFGIRLKNFIFNVTNGYTFIIFLISIKQDKPFTLSRFVLVAIVYLVVVFDTYLFDSMAEYVTQVCQETRSFLRQSCSDFDAGEGLAPSSKAMEWFAVHLSFAVVRIRVFDAVLINRTNTFSIFVQIFLHTIFLVQSDRDLWKGLY